MGRLPSGPRPPVPSARPRRSRRQAAAWRRSAATRGSLPASRLAGELARGAASRTEIDRAARRAARDGAAGRRRGGPGEAPCPGGGRRCTRIEGEGGGAGPGDGALRGAAPPGPGGPPGTGRGGGLDRDPPGPIAGRTWPGPAGRRPRAAAGRRSRGAASPARSNWDGERTTCSRGRSARCSFFQVRSSVSTTSVQTSSDSLRTRICWPPRRESLRTWTSAPIEFPGPDDGQAIQRARNEAASHPPTRPSRAFCQRPARRNPSIRSDVVRRPWSSAPSTSPGTPFGRSPMGEESHLHRGPCAGGTDGI